MVPFLVIDVGFFVANAAKFFQGGWVPAAGGDGRRGDRWRSGSSGGRGSREKTRRDEVPLQFLVENLAKKKPTIVPGTAMFLTSRHRRRADGAAAQPQALQGAARAQRDPDRRHLVSAARVGRREGADRRL